MNEAIAIEHLIEDRPPVAVEGATDVQVSGVTEDSRRVSDGDLFIARAGETHDGHTFIADAIEAGAAAVVVERPWADLGVDRPDGVTVLQYERVDELLVGELAERVYGRPSEQLRLVGVTGTNGKTTVAYLLRHLLKATGTSCGMIGTVVVDTGDREERATLTTPSAADLSRTLAEMVAAGCTAAVLEVSSHALDQGRVAALKFDAGIYTNLSGDHLDYHPDMASYAAAKAKLFAMLPERGWAVVNADDEYMETMLADCPARPVKCRMRSSADAAPDDTEPPSTGEATATPLALEKTYSRVRFDGPWGSLDVRLPLVGRHNAINALQAVAAAHALGAPSGEMHEALASCPQVPGRLERVT
ncbi:MAG: UDP-N-acetylmuramyl-tripeptide synthetase, partial [Phycisphaeraceae bacterium]|nr:UDP-N-acetylmuramyl-tripeptide synthetase [Phycisphaeraceae bacterium]